MANPSTPNPSLSIPPWTSPLPCCSALTVCCRSRIALLAFDSYTLRRAPSRHFCQALSGPGHSTRRRALPVFTLPGACRRRARGSACEGDLSHRQIDMLTDVYRLRGASVWTFTDDGSRSAADAVRQAVSWARPLDNGEANSQFLHARIW